MIPAVQQKPNEFSLSEARNIVKDLFKPNPFFYWFDLLITYGLAVYCFQQVRGGSLFVPHQGFTGELPQMFFFVVSCLLFYRAGLFIHELVHQRTGLRVFRIVWNLLCGIPFLIPSFVYYTHIDHHRRASYGTEHDGEYMPMAHRSRWFLLMYLAMSFVIPIAVVIRFTLLTPLAWLRPSIRTWIHQHASSMVMDPTYVRPLPTQRVLRIVYLQEFACFVWCWGIAIVPPLLLHRWPIPFLIHAYLTSVFIIMLNSLRTLGSHLWTNSGGEMTFLQQLLDSVNYSRSPWITEIWGPVGTRFHALHHLFPSLPYHAMPKAHRLLMERLPQDSIYRKVEARSLISVLSHLWRISHRRQESRNALSISIDGSGS